MFVYVHLSNELLVAFHCNHLLKHDCHFPLCPSHLYKRTQRKRSFVVFSNQNSLH